MPARKVGRLPVRIQRLISAPPSCMILAEQMLALKRPKGEIALAVRQHETGNPEPKSYSFTQWCILRQARIARFSNELPLLATYAAGLDGTSYLLACRRGHQRLRALTHPQKGGGA